MFKNCTFKNNVIQIDGSPFLFLEQKDYAQEQFAYFSGLKKLNEENIIKFKKNIEFNSSYCAQRNIPYLHVIFPGKIPVFKDLFSQAGFDVKPIYSCNHASPFVVYPFDILIPEIHYFVQDTHLNDCGKLEVISYVFQKLNLEWPFEKPIYEAFNLQGDLGAKLLKEPFLEQRINGFVGRDNNIKIFSTSSALTGNMGQIFFYYNGNSYVKKRLLVFGDSFIQTSVKILSYYFEEVVYFRTPYILFDVANILEPDFIITSNAERYLASVPDYSKSKPYFLNYFTDVFVSNAFAIASRDALINLLSGRDSFYYKKWKRQVGRVLTD